MARLGLLGVWHVHAADYLRKAKELAEIVGLYEDDAARAAAFSAEHGLPVFDSPEALFASGIDGVIVCASTDRHAELIVAAANAGLDVFTEKVLALTSAECDRIADAVEQNGVRFVISFPKKFEAAMLTLRSIAESGELGELNYMRVRNCHGGAVAGWLPPHFYCAKQCGGGAMIDLGAHGMYLIDAFLGMPESYRSVFTVAMPDNPKNTDRLEDNAVTVMRYPNGCIAINETGFVSGVYPLTVELGGSLGCARFDGVNVVKTTVSTGKKPVEAELLPRGEEPIVTFAKGGVPDGCSMAEAKNLTRMMEGAYRAL